MESVTIGLDIGASAVRAAELQVTKDGRRVLRRYGQVGLPAGAVSDGEVNDTPAVAAALRRLWDEGGFTSREVVVGVSGPRVFVRQADVAALSVEDLRSSLKFDGQEMIPIPMDDASFDFSILGPAETNSRGEGSQRILLVAAHRDLLQSYHAALAEAGLNATAMDAVPLALMRAVPHSGADGAGGTEVLVSIGAELTTVAVREAGIPRFIRSLTVGGATLTDSIASAMHVEVGVAERLKRGALPSDAPQVKRARKAMTADMRQLAEDVRATIDFFLSQAGGADMSRLLITGGASQTEGLVAAIVGDLPATVVTVDALEGIDISGLDYDEAQTRLMAASATTAIGLARWPTDAPLIRLSVLPEEILEARKTRRMRTLAGGAVAGLVVVLAIAAGVQALAVHSEEGKVHSAQREVASLQGQVSKLQAITAVHGKVVSRAALVSSSLKGDVDWVRVLGQLATVMPPQLSLTSFAGTKTTASAASGTAAASATPTVGQLTFSVTGGGGLPSAAAWIDGLAGDPDISNLTVTGITVQSNGGQVTFSSTAELTPVSYSNRDKEVQP